MEFDRGQLGDAGKIASIGNDTSTKEVFFRAPNGTLADLGAGDSPVDYYIVRIDFQGGSDGVRIYRNPTSGVEAAMPTATLTNAGDMSFSGVCVGADNNYVAVDEIRLGTAWADALGTTVANLLPPDRQAGGWNIPVAATPSASYHVQRAMDFNTPIVQNGVYIGDNTWGETGGVENPTLQNQPPRVGGGRTGRRLIRPHQSPDDRPGNRHEQHPRPKLPA